MKRALIGLVVVAAACATGTGGEGGGFAGAAGAGASAGSGAAGGGGSGGLDIDGSVSSTKKVFAHTDFTLFSLDPLAPDQGLKQLGDFDCIGGPGEDVSMTDVAVDQDGSLFGVSATAIWPLTVADKIVHCGSPISLSQVGGVKFYALSFAPVGVLDPDEEVLVAGNTAGELWSIRSNGAVAKLGNFGLVPANDGNGHSYEWAGKPWELSGDIVFLANQGNPVGFATVRDCENPPSTLGCSNDDTLIEINVPALATAAGGSVTKAVRGKIVKRAGCNDGVNGSYDNMYGIGAWNDKVYGLSRRGYLVEIAVADGSACLVREYASTLFSGAGVTTEAPIVVPPPK